MNRGTLDRVLKRGMPAILAAAVGLSTALAQAPAKTTVSDAQVEADVLKALAGASDLTNQAITTTTVYGVVTLSGSVQTEAQRTEAENLASRTQGVQKVVDEMTLTSETASAQPTPDGAAPMPDAQNNQPQNPNAQQQSNPSLQSDGTMAPQGQAPPPPDMQQPQSPNQANGPNYGPGAPEYRQPYNPQQAPPPPGYPQQGANGYPQQPQGYPQQPQGYPQPPQGYPQYPQQQQGYGAPPPPQGYYGAPAYAGQQAGETVTVPSGALIRVRINQTLDSAKTKPGDHFDGIVINDVAAGGAVAIPRGASIQGVVVDAKKSGALAGRGELSLQLTQVTLGGKTYPIVSDVWAHNGADKTVQSVNSTAIGGGLGALVGAAAGGGQGAAIGAGVGGLLGLGASAASHSGQVFVPSEGLLTFHLAQPATVATVSQQEMDRMAQGAGPNGGPAGLQRRYPGPYYGPGYYRPYPYPYPYPY